SELFVLALERLTPPDQIGRSVLGRRHQPGSRPLRHAGDGPLLERGNERVLRELLGGPDVADEASQPGDEPGRLDPPDRFDRAVRLFGGAFASRIYGPSPLTHPRAWRSRGPRSCRCRTVRA